MLPHEEIWVFIKEIALKSPWFPGGKKVKEYDEELFQEIIHIEDTFYVETYVYPDRIVDLIEEIPGIDFSYRYKKPSSIKVKFERLDMTKQLYKIDNDLLGMRFILKTDNNNLMNIVEEFVSFCPFGEESCTIIDQTNGKKRDDGYKGIHVNFRPNSTMIPIEIQFWTRPQALLNEYLHANIYKIDNTDLNQYALDVRGWLEDVPTIPESDGISVQSYVDFIYEMAFNSNYEDLEEEFEEDK